MAVKDETGRLTEDELAATAMLLLGAGFETTVNLIGNGTVAARRPPRAARAAAAEPALWPNAVEEVLRYDSPVQRTARVAMAPTRLAGSALTTGQLVVALIGGANRDPAVFDDPHRFDVARANARDHLAFSAGVHYCLGAALARLEGEIGLRTLFERFPDLALAGTPDPSRHPGAARLRRDSGEASADDPRRHRRARDDVGQRAVDIRVPGAEALLVCVVGEDRELARGDRVAHHRSDVLGVLRHRACPAAGRTIRRGGPPGGRTRVPTRRGWS